MTATATRQITLNLPEKLVKRLNDVAEQQHQPFESIVSDILETSLPSLELQAKAQFAQARNRLAGQSAEELQASAQSAFSATDKERALELLAFNTERALTPLEQAELEAFYEKTEANAATRAAALWLLERK